MLIHLLLGGGYRRMNKRARAKLFFGLFVFLLFSFIFVGGGETDSTGEGCYEVETCENITSMECFNITEEVCDEKCRNETIENCANETIPCTPECYDVCIEYINETCLEYEEQCKTIENCETNCVNETICENICIQYNETKVCLEYEEQCKTYEDEFILNCTNITQEICEDVNCTNITIENCTEIIEEVCTTEIVCDELDNKREIGLEVDSGATSPGTMTTFPYGSNDWVNPDNAKSSDDSYTIATIPVADAPLVKIQDKYVKIIKADGSLGTTNKAKIGENWPTEDTYVSYGGSDDLWGESWTPADINNVNFGVVLAERTIDTTDSDIYNSSYYLNATNFGFSIPGDSTIEGIIVEIEKKGTISDNVGTAYVDHIRITVYYADTTPPTISSIESNSPQGYGYNISINSTVTDTSNVSDVLVQITFPNASIINFSMSNITEDIYNYQLDDTWQWGEHNYTIFANDSLGNMGNSSQYSFNISISATISIKTLNDTYGISKQVNLTDPPSEKQEIDNIITNSSLMEENENNIKEIEMPKTIENKVLIENPEDEISIIIEFEETPLLPYEKIADKESETSLLTKTLNIFLSREVAQSFVKNRKIKSHTKEILDTHNDIAKKLKKDYKDLEIKREWKDLMNGMAITIKRKDLEKIKNLHDVKNVWEDENLTILLDDSVPLINADDVWKELDGSGDNITGNGIKVAIIDTGIAYNHPAFEPSCDTSAFISGNCNKTIYGYDFYNDDNDPYDDNGHGTHCAGIVASENSTYKGVAPNATLLAYKVCSSGGSCPSSNVISGIENATLYGADVISISLGGAGYADNVFQTSIDNAVANGTVVIISAGNAGPRFYTVGSPGATLSAITVGATDKSNNIASFSSRGFSLYSNGSIAGIKPDVVAPGVYITSTVPFGSCTHCTSTGYKSLSGTSMSAPHVAGAIALLKQAYPDWTSSQFKSAISNPALNIGENPNTQGSGRVDVDKSYNISGIITDNNLVLGENKNKSISIWNNTETLNITNPQNFEIIYSLSIEFSETGMTVDLSNSSIILQANESALFNVTISVNSSLASTGTYYGNISVNNPLNDILKIPFAVYLILNPEGCITDDTYISVDTTLSGDTCSVPDLGGNGVLIIDASNIILDCNHSIYDGLDTNYGTLFVESGSKGISSSNRNLENITIKNCNIRGYKNGIFVYFQEATIENNNLSNNMLSGINVEDGTYDHIIGNNILIDNKYGLYMHQYTGRNKVYDNIISSSVSHSMGMYIGNTYSSNFSNNTINSVGWESIRIEKNSYDNIFINNTLKNAGITGLLLWYDSIENNTFLNSNIIDSSTGILIIEAKNNNITGFDISGGTSSLRIDGGFNNRIFDSTFDKRIVGQSSDSTTYLINTTFPYTLLYGESSLINQWYLTINVTDENLNSLQNVNITIYENTTGTEEIEWSKLTDSDGLISLEPTIEYFENETGKYYAYPTNITGSKYLYYPNSTSVNLTTNTEVHLILPSGASDVTPPVITILSPENKTYNTTEVWANVTLNEDGDWCGYSLDGGSNVTMDNSSTTYWYYNITGLSDNQSYNILFNCNDTAGNLGESKLVSFAINSSYEKEEEEIKSMINNTGTLNFTGYLTLKVQKDISGTWTDHKIITDNLLININTTAPFALDTQWASDGSYITNETGTFRVIVELKSKSGEILKRSDTDYLNATYNFTVTGAEVPVVTIVTPATDSYFNINSTMLNYTVTDDVDSSLTCWYDLDGVITASPNNPISNGTYDTINLTDLIEGSHTVYVICQDSVPQNGTSSTNTFYIDETKPTMYNPDPADGDFVEGSASETFKISVNDEISLDTDSGKFFWRYPSGEPFNEEEMTCSASLCSFDLDMSVIGDGEDLDFYFEIKDMAGNLGNNGMSINPLTITKNSTAPVVNSLDEPANNSKLSVNTVQFNFTATNGNPDTAILYINGIANETLSPWVSGTKNSFDLVTLADGIYKWTVWVNDTANNGAWYPSNYTLTIDTPPIFEPVSNFALDEDFGSFTLDLSDNITDDTDLDSDLKIQWTESDTTAVYVDSLDNSTDIITFKSKANQSGSSDINLTVWDTSGNQDSTKFTLTINPINDAPWITTYFDNITALEDFSTFNAIVVADLNANFSDVEEDGSPTTYELITSSNTSTSCYFDGSNNFECSSVANASGTDTYKLSLNDSGGLGAVFDWQIIVTAVNNPPTKVGEFSNATADEDDGLIENILQKTDFDNNWSDVEDATPTTYEVVEQSDNSIVDCVFDGSNNLDCTTQANKSGTNLLILSANDSSGKSVEWRWQITINTINDIPWWDTIPTQSSNEDTPDEFNVSAYAWDVETPPESFLFDFINNNTGLISIKLDNSTGNLSWFPLANQNGDANISVIVYDEDGGSEQTEFNLHITAVNDAPNQTQIQTPANNSNHSSLPSFCWGNSSDVDGDVLTYNWEVDDDETFASIDYTNSSVSETATPTCDIPTLSSDGNYWARVRADDDTVNGTWSELLYFTYESTPPSLILFTPENSSTKNSIPVEFKYNVTDLHTVLSCNLTLNDEMIENRTSITQGNNSFTSIKLSNGKYNYSVVCTDEFNNVNKSETYDFTVSVGYETPTTGPGGTGTTGGGSPLGLNASYLCRKIKIFLEEHPTIYTAYDIGNLRQNISDEIGIVPSKTLVNQYINNYDTLCFNVSEEEIIDEEEEKKKIIDITTESCSVDVDGSINFVLFEIPIYKAFRLPKIGIGDISCKSINFWKHILRLERNGEITITGIRIYVVLLLMIIGYVIYIIKRTTDFSFLEDLIRRNKNKNQ